MKHTKEPWRVEDKTEVVTTVNHYPSTIADCFNHAAVERRDAEENARRIVACVNACAGIPNEVLELDKPQFVTILEQRSELLAQACRARNLIECGDTAAALNCLCDAIDATKRHNAGDQARRSVDGE